MSMKVKLLRGTPGSGKSTYAKKLANAGYLHYENDQYFMHDGKYEFDQKKAKDAANWCYSQFMKALRAKRNVVVSNVFVTCKAVDRYADIAKTFGADVEVIRFNGDFGNVHDVPANVYASMKRAFQDYPGEKVFDYEKGAAK